MSVESYTWGRKSACSSAVGCAAVKELCGEGMGVPGAQKVNGVLVDQQLTSS